STIRTLIGSMHLGCSFRTAASRALGTWDLSARADSLKFAFKRFAIKWLHDIFVSARLDRGANMGDAVFGGAEHHLGARRDAALTERLQELHTAHHRHVPIEQDDVRH